MIAVARRAFFKCTGHSHINPCHVRACRHKQCHVTADHRCGKCGESGHGQIECGHGNRVALDAHAKTKCWPRPNEGPLHTHHGPTRVLRVPLGIPLCMFCAEQKVSSLQRVWSHIEQYFGIRKRRMACAANRIHPLYLAFATNRQASRGVNEPSRKRSVPEGSMATQRSKPTGPLARFVKKDNTVSGDMGATVALTDPMRKWQSPPFSAG